MRHRTDANQKEIVAALRKIGATVYICQRPLDLVVGYRGFNFLLDCKGRYTPDTKFQKTFFKEWRGQKRKVFSAEEAIKVVTESYGGKNKTP